MHPKLIIWSELVHTYFCKSPDTAISLSYRLVLARALGALGRRFESCRPDSNNPSYRQVTQPVFFMPSFRIMRLSEF